MYSLSADVSLFVVVKVGEPCGSCWMWSIDTSVNIQCSQGVNEKRPLPAAEQVEQNSSYRPLIVPQNS